MAAAVVPLAGTELMEMSQLSATVTKTATTISAINSDNSYNDSGSGFVAAGFVVGQRIKVTGFSTSGGVNNILTGVLTAVTAAKLTLAGTDGNVIVDEAAGASITITKWETKHATVKDVGAGSNTSFQAFGSPASASHVLTLDLSKSSNFSTVLTENVTTVTLSNLTAGAANANFFTLLVKQNGTGGWTFANPASWKFPAAASYTASSSAGAVDLIQGVTYDQGTTWLITYAKGFG